MNRILIGLIVSFLLVFLAFICFYSLHINKRNGKGISYLPQLAKELTSASIIAYCHPDQIIKWDIGKIEDLHSKVDKNTIQYISENDNFGYFVYSPQYNAIQIVFRGSISITNWFDNIRILQTNFNVGDCYNCKVHTGFYYSYLRLKDQFDDVFINYYLKKYPDANIQFTGHSLGGALSILFAAHTFELLQNQTNKIKAIYTVGQPRVGNKEFADWFNQKCEEYEIGDYRLSKYGDPIPFALPQNLGFYHTGFNVYYSSEDKFEICAGDCIPQQTFLPKVIHHSNYFGWDWNSMTYGTQCKKNEFNPNEFKPSFKND